MSDAVTPRAATIPTVAPEARPAVRQSRSRPLLESFHPLAVTRAFCPEETFRELAGKIRMTKFEIRIIVASGEPK